MVCYISFCKHFFILFEFFFSNFSRSHVLPRTNYLIQGVLEKDVDRLRSIHGLNQLDPPEPISISRLIWNSWNNAANWALGSGLFRHLFLGDFVQAGALFGSLSAVMAFAVIPEIQAHRKLEKLMAVETGQVHVLRDSSEKVVFCLVL